MVQSKLDSDTLHFLQEAEKHVDTDTHNLRVEDSLSDHQVTYCLWGNVIKNPRSVDNYRAQGKLSNILWLCVYQPMFDGMSE